VKLPIDVRALYDAGKRLKADREHPVRLAVLVEIDAPDTLVEAARAMLRPRTATGIVDVAVIEPEQMLRVDSKADAVIVLAGSGTHLEPTLKDLRVRAIPCVVLAVRADGLAFAQGIAQSDRDVLTGDDALELFPGQLADWLMARLGKLHTALGHNFAFVRRAVAREAVRHCAWQNAALGAVLFIPGADMPVMTLNQGRMLLNIAAAYGQAIDKDRIKELAAVVAGGLVFRTFAREVVGLVPGFGWAVKAGIAYSGTMAMGTAAISYFESGADLSGVVRSLSERAGDAAAHIRGRHVVPTSALSAEPFAAVAAPEPAAAHQPVLIDMPPVEPIFGVLDDMHVPEPTKGLSR
jgi:uncharacterized protein (DUF697 family)